MSFKNRTPPKWRNGSPLGSHLKPAQNGVATQSEAGRKLPNRAPASAGAASSLRLVPGPGSSLSLDSKERHEI